MQILQSYWKNMVIKVEKICSVDYTSIYTWVQITDEGHLQDICLYLKVQKQQLVGKFSAIKLKASYFFRALYVQFFLRDFSQMDLKCNFLLIVDRANNFPEKKICFQTINSCYFHCCPLLKLDWTMDNSSEVGWTELLISFHSLS